MKITICHIRSNYAEVDETAPYGQNARTQGFLSVLVNILQELGHDVDIVKVRIAHPFRKSKISQDKQLLINFSKSTIVYRGVLKFLKVIFNRLSPNYFKNLMNQIDSMIVSCDVNELKRKLANTSDKVILIFDDISSCYLFKDIRILKESDNTMIFYLSHDYYIDAITPILKNKIKSCEENIIRVADLVITSGSRDLELYRASYYSKRNNFISFANVFPPINPPYSITKLSEALSTDREKDPTIVLNIGAKVLEKHILTYLGEVSEAVRELENLKILVIGEKLIRYLDKFKWGKNKIEPISYISSRLGFLRQLSRAHIGVNYAYKSVGTNVKRFDFALAGLVILSRHPGSRGEFLPYEYVYIDPIDLRVKLRKLLECNLGKMGEENRVEAIKIAIESYENLLNKLQIFNRKLDKGG